MVDNFEELMDLQKRMIQKARSEFDFDLKAKLISLIQKTIPSGKAIQIESVYIISNENGFSDDLIGETINTMIDEKILFIPKDGYIQKEFR
jgi:hypothetical protein